MNPSAALTRLPRRLFNRLRARLAPYRNAKRLLGLFLLLWRYPALRASTVARWWGVSRTVVLRLFRTLRLTGLATLRPHGHLRLMALVLPLSTPLPSGSGLPGREVKPFRGAPGANRPEGFEPSKAGIRAASGPRSGAGVLPPGYCPGYPAPFQRKPPPPAVPGDPPWRYFWSGRWSEGWPVCDRCQDGFRPDLASTCDCPRGRNRLWCLGHFQRRTYAKFEFHALPTIPDLLGRMERLPRLGRREIEERIADLDARLDADPSTLTGADLSAIQLEIEALRARLGSAPDPPVSQRADAYQPFVSPAARSDPDYLAWRARFLASYQTPAKEPAPPPPKRPRAPPFQPAVQNFKPVS